MIDLSPEMQFPVFLAVAFVSGLLARYLGLLPLVGFLVAGFCLRALGFAPNPGMEALGDMGVTLLLFSIGLKLKVRNLARPEIWAGTTIHMGLMTLIAAGALGAGAAFGLSSLTGMSFQQAALIGFALSFSSTVFAVKALETAGEMNTVFGQTAMGILIMQDIVAVAFLTASTGAIPSPWALLLPLIWFTRPALGYLLDRVGYGEMLALFGLFAAVVLGAALFKLVGMKPDLGALIMGLMIGSHKKAAEVADSLFSLKEVLLVGFFVSIGMSALPTLSSVTLAAILTLLLPIKAALFFLLLTRFDLRARTSILSSLTLANFSEFGLIVAAVAVTNGWLGEEWLVILALTTAMSLMGAKPLSGAGLWVYARLQTLLTRFETHRPHPSEVPIRLGDAEVAIFGMGRVGTGAYEYLRERYGDRIVGIEVDEERVQTHRDAGRNVIVGDATDLDFWQRACMNDSSLRLVMLAMPEHRSNLYALEQIREGGYQGYVAALAGYPSQVEALLEAGAHVAFDTYAEAGAGFAGHVDGQIADLCRP